MKEQEHTFVLMLHNLCFLFAAEALDHGVCMSLNYGVHAGSVAFDAVGRVLQNVCFAFACMW